MGLSSLVLLVCTITAAATLHVNNGDTTAILDDANLKNLDIYVRSEILHKILEKLNETTIYQNVQSDACKLKVKSSMSTCTACFNNLCRQGQSTGGQSQMNRMFSTLMPMIFKPQLLVGSIVDFIGAGLPSALSLLGTGGKLFVDKVGGLANELGHTFGDASSLFRGISSEFKKIGKTLLSNAGSLLHGFQQGAGSLLSSAGSGAGSLLNQAEHGAETLLHGFQSAGSALSNLGQKVGTGLVNVGSTVVKPFSDLFHSIFGKRELAVHVKRCNSACPVCDNLNLKAHTKEQVLISVCGEQYVGAQSLAVQHLTSLRHLYNTTLLEPLITRVDYNPSSLVTMGGVSFSMSHFTFDKNGQEEKIRSNFTLGVTDLKATAKKMADQIWSLTDY